MPKSGLSEALASAAKLNAGAALAMREQKVLAATDVTGFALLGHLGNMIKASSAAHNQKFGARSYFSKISTFESIEALLGKGLSPTGSKRNLELAGPLTTFDKGLSYEKRLLLADAQTSVGLLMRVPKHRLDKF